eukprot:12379950-Ditylum_brightwellii.AAC.3
MAADTVIEKKEFEQMDAGHNVSIQQCHWDNRIFKSKLLNNHYDDMGQHPTSMSWVGAHHQNAVAELAIGTVVQSARTVLLHATIYWPAALDLILWPFALSYAANIWN